MKNKKKAYGKTLDGVEITDKIAKKMVKEGFNSLKRGDVKILKSKSIEPLKISVKRLPLELQKAVLYA